MLEKRDRVGNHLEVPIPCWSWEEGPKRGIGRGERGNNLDGGGGKGTVRAIS